jgi:hypothetical protein
MKNKKRIHCTYITCFPVNGKREQCIEQEVCMYILYINIYIYVYVFCVCFSRKALRRRPVSRNGKWSPTFFSLPLTPFYFYLFFVSSFSRSRTPPSSPGYRSRGFFFFFSLHRPTTTTWVSSSRVYTSGDIHPPRSTKEPKGALCAAAWNDTRGTVRMAFTWWTFELVRDQSSLRRDASARSYM